MEKLEEEEEVSLWRKSSLAEEMRDELIIQWKRSCSRWHPMTPPSLSQTYSSPSVPRATFCHTCTAPSLSVV